MIDESIKKQRKPRTKKIFVEEVKEPALPEPVQPKKRNLIKNLHKSATVQNIQKPAQIEEISYNGPCILSVDPAFKKCGFAVIRLDNGGFIDSFQQEMRPFSEKLTQAQVDGYLSNNVQKVIKMLFQKYKIEFVVIELQLGNFSADRIQLAFVQALPENVQYTVQHSKLKLKHPEIKDIKADNPDSNKYNQNKHSGRQLAQILYPNMPKLTFDEYDSLLHAKYAYNNISKIAWVVKSNLN